MSGTVGSGTVIEVGARDDRVLHPAEETETYGGALWVVTVIWACCECSRGQERSE